MSIDSVCRTLLDDFRARPTVRAGSLIVTVFGDAIAPRGGTLWLGSLIRLMAEFGISERLVRTSVFRLANDGWLESEQRGRKAYYSLTAAGRERFRAATHRIYGAPAAGWDGHWCVLLLSTLDTAARDAVRKECGWLGFGSLSTNVLAHPSPDVDDLDDTLKRLGVVGDVVVLTGHTVHSDEAMRRLARQSWNLEDIDARYRRFVERFEPARRAASNAASIAPLTAFVIRTLLIQEYRKVLLRDPKMPLELLPDGWQGTPAYRLCRDLYRAVYSAADEYITANVESLDGALPLPGDDYEYRFGGLSAAG
ncbi:MAG: phenylacetic acid degradation operon negative regulatory protein PaaX [Woeseiaceae bacterium]|nr:phenylacetic acid degradation operon negative regulatory protein PaaX [Woeseiaceae bacterium]